MSVYEREEIENKIKLLMKKYYRDYYLIKLGLPDFKSRINNRLNETENASYYIDKVAKWINYKFDKTKKVLVQVQSLCNFLVEDVMSMQLSQMKERLKFCV